MRLTKKSCEKEMKKVLDNSRLDVIRYQSCCKRETKTTSKKLLTSKKIYDNISELLFERFKKATKNNLKKLLTNMKHFDII